MPFQIQSQAAKISINTTKGSFHMQQPKGKLNIETTYPKMQIDRKLPRVIIDQYQCFAEAGLKNIFDLTREYAQMGKQKALEAIANINQEGDRTADICSGIPEAIPEIAQSKIGSDEKEFNIDTIPKSRPRIDVEGHLNIAWEIGGTNINYIAQKPIINIEKNNVEIYLRQKPKLDIRYIDERI